MTKLIAFLVILSLGAAVTIVLNGLPVTSPDRAVDRSPDSGEPIPPPTESPNRPGEQAAQPTPQRGVEPIRPYVLKLGSDHVTICWMTRDESVGKVRLFSYSKATEHTEQRPASPYHKVSIEGLSPATTYRYEIGLNYQGSFRTADASPWFEAAVFGHPGGTERPLEYPTEMLQARLLAIAPEIALCTGDITFRATLRNFRDAFFHRFGDFMSSRPIYVAPSNHDGRWNGVDYKQFRQLFPYDFGPETGGSYWFDYKQARFFALTYKLNTPELFREHVTWLADAIDKSGQEFNIVFLGGQEPKYFDKDMLFQSLAKRRVELVLGGDGGGTSQAQLHGLDFYFSGDGDLQAYPFYYLRFYEHHFNVQTHYSDASRKSRNHRSFYSKKRRRVLQQLKPKLQPSEQHLLHYTGIDETSTSVGGLHMTIDWDHDIDVELQLWVKPKNGGYVKEQCHLIKAKTKTEVLIAIPDVRPASSPGVPYELAELIIRLAEHRAYTEDYQLHGKISDVYLFAK